MADDRILIGLSVGYDPQYYVVLKETPKKYKVQRIYAVRVPNGERETVDFRSPDGYLLYPKIPIKKSERHGPFWLTKRANGEIYSGRTGVVKFWEGSINKIYDR